MLLLPLISATSPRVRVVRSALAGERWLWLDDASPASPRVRVVRCAVAGEKRLRRGNGSQRVHGPAWFDVFENELSRTMLRCKVSVLQRWLGCVATGDAPQTPNDPKLSDCGARRAGCGDVAGAGWAKAAGRCAAASVTRGAVRCSALLGVVRSRIGLVGLRVSYHLAERLPRCCCCTDFRSESTGASGSICSGGGEVALVG